MADKEGQGGQGETKSPWLGGMFSWGRASEPKKKAVKAHLGEENKFYFNEDLKRWVVEGEEHEAAASAVPPPPPLTFSTPSSSIPTTPTSAVASEHGSQPQTPVSSVGGNMGLIDNMVQRSPSLGRTSSLRMKYIDPFSAGTSPANTVPSSPKESLVPPSLVPNASFGVPSALVPTPGVKPFMPAFFVPQPQSTEELAEGDGIQGSSSSSQQHSYNFRADTPPPPAAEGGGGRPPLPLPRINTGSVKPDVLVAEKQARFHSEMARAESSNPQALYRMDSGSIASAMDGDAATPAPAAMGFSPNMHETVATSGVKPDTPIPFAPSPVKRVHSGGESAFFQDLDSHTSTPKSHFANPTNATFATTIYDDKRSSSSSGGRGGGDVPHGWTPRDFTQGTPLPEPIQQGWRGSQEEEPTQQYYNGGTIIEGRGGYTNGSEHRYPQGGMPLMVEAGDGGMNGNGGVQQQQKVDQVLGYEEQTHFENSQVEATTTVAAAQEEAPVPYGGDGQHHAHNAFQGGGDYSNYYHQQEQYSYAPAVGQIENQYEDYHQPPTDYYHQHHGQQQNGNSAYMAGENTYASAPRDGWEEGTTDDVREGTTTGSVEHDYNNDDSQIAESQGSVDTAPGNFELSKTLEIPDQAYGMTFPVNGNEQVDSPTIGFLGDSAASVDKATTAPSSGLGHLQAPFSEIHRMEARINELEKQLDTFLKLRDEAVAETKAAVESHEEEMADLLCCLGQEGKKVSVLTEKLTALGVDVDPLMDEIENDFSLGG